MNTDAAVRAYLVSVAGVTAAVSTRVYDTIVPEDPTVPLLTYATEGGADDPNLPIASPEYRFTGWATTLAGSKAAFAAAATAIKNLSNYKSGSIILEESAVAQDGQPQSDRDAETGNYYTTGKWTIYAKDVS